MINWDVYEQFINIDGNSPKDRNINQFIHSIKEQFKNNPNYREVTFNNDANVVGVWILTGKPNNTIIRVDGNLEPGTIINDGNKKWLITTVDSTFDYYAKGTIQLCNNTLNVYKNYILYQIPCIVESNVRLYSMSVDETKYISQLEDNIIVRVPNNNITSSIQVNDIYKLGRWNYKVTNLSDVIEPGLLVLKMQLVAEEQQLPNYTLEILNGDNLQISQSQQLIINAEVKDNGIVIPSPPLLYQSSDESIATIDENGAVTILGVGTVVFTVSLVSDTTVNDSMTVEIVADEQDNFTYTLIGDAEIIKGNTKTYIAQKYNNGLIVDGTEFTFTVIPGNTPTSAYTLTIIDDDQCSITARSATYNITLRATDNSNGQYIEKIIKLKNLF